MKSKILKNILFIFILCILLIILGLILNYTEIKIKTTYKEKNNSFKEIFFDNGNIQYESDNVVYENNFLLKINIFEYTKNNYTVNIKNNELDCESLNITQQETSCVIELKEGINQISLNIFKDGNLIKNEIIEIYYVTKYKKQFLDELDTNGIQVHYRNGTKEDFNKSSVLLEALGIQYIRADFLWWDIEPQNGKYSFKNYDNWVNSLGNNYKIIAIINDISKYSGDNKLIDNDTEIEHIKRFILEISKHYQFINNFEILNEVNMNSDYKDAYLSIDKMYWYSKMLNEICKINNKFNIITAGTAMPSKNGNDEITSYEFYKNMYETGGLNNLLDIAIHPYVNAEKPEQIKNKVDETYEQISQYGGFTNIDITEYGEKYLNVQTNNLIKETVKLKEKSKLIILYNLWSTTDENNMYGIIRNDYTPKPAYYSMKNYYQNTNGAEYIGQVNIANGIEAHVYDKDGKPKIIAWATDTNKPVTIDYLGFKASDLYGKEIENTNGKLEITTSPVYIDNVSTKNFYQAISNSITTGYKEFDEKFANEINKVPELKTKISNLNTFAESLKNVNTLDENIANSKMKEHFSLGNTIIKAYDDGRLDIEYVKLSSILDYLNTIGNAYEDLITVSAKTRITDLTSITNEVNEAKSIIENDTDIDIVYPNKIYKFSKDLLDTSSYVLGLDEENDIKTGLINSKATHAKYLADWSEEFSKIYIKGWLQGKINIIKDENSKIYSKNEQLKSNTKISTKYNSLIENLNNLPSQTTSITKDTINSIYNQQYELINTIVDEFNNKKLNISESEYQTLITELLNISEQYKELFNTYITEDDIQNSTIENNINNVIDRYNENKDIDMTMCAELINNIKEIYNDKIQTEETSYNYLNKRRIQNTCTIISKMLENKIKETAQQEAQKIGIAYNIDQSTLTNKDVIAQIKLPNSKSSIESNPNNEKYTFTENGTKNITINIRGYKYNYNIKVTNIDKTPPQMTGIEQGGKYKESITPQITDENLSEVKLIKDGQEVENYKKNTAITQEGIYQLKATDKAGNETSINFVIAYPEDEKYKIENNTIKNIKGETSVETLKGKLQVDEKYTIKRKDTEIQNSENIATGDILETESGNKYTLIVRGDLNKDGKVDIKDLVKMRKFLLLGNNLEESEEMAADTNIDGKEISIKDLVKMRIILLTQ